MQPNKPQPPDRPQRHRLARVSRRPPAVDELGRSLAARGALMCQHCFIELEDTMQKRFLILSCIIILALQQAQAQSTKIQLNKKNLESQSFVFKVEANPSLHGEHFRIFVDPKAEKSLPPVHSARLAIFRGREPISDCLIETKQRANGKGVAYGFFVSSKFLTDSMFILAFRDPESLQGPAQVYIFNLKEFANSR